MNVLSGNNRFLFYEDTDGNRTWRVPEAYVSLVLAGCSSRLTGIVRFRWTPVRITTMPSAVAGRGGYSNSLSQSCVIK